MESNIPPLISTDPRVTVGRFTYGDPRFRIWGEKETIQIGAFCSIADDVTIFGGGEHRSDWVTTFPLRIALGSSLAGMDGHPTTKGPTCIGSDVWIGHGATILSGVTIGHGAIIGACALVARDVPAYHVAVGNPAVVTRARFKEEQIRKLCEIRWWEWSIDIIRTYEDLLCGADVDAFIRAAPQIPGAATCSADEPSENVPVE